MPAPAQPKVVVIGAELPSHFRAVDDSTSRPSA